MTNKKQTQKQRLALVNEGVRLFSQTQDKVNLALTYVKDGAFHTGGELLIEAGNMLKECQHLKNRANGG